MKYLYKDLQVGQLNVQINNKQQLIMSEDSYQQHCNHQEEIVFLRQKFSEVHSKLMQQIQITKEKELEIIVLKKSQKNHINDTNTQFESTSTEATKNQKIWLLEQNLEAMRKKVMEEIKEKKELKKKMAEQTIKYENDMKQAKQQFEGLEILYFKLLETNSHPQKKVGQLTGTDRCEIKNLKPVDRRQVQLRYLQKEKENNIDSSSKSKKKKLQIDIKSEECHFSGIQDRERVLRQMQEVKHTFERQNKLKAPNLIKQKLDTQLPKAKQSIETTKSEHKH